MERIKQSKHRIVTQQDRRIFLYRGYSDVNVRDVCSTAALLAVEVLFFPPPPLLPLKVCRTKESESRDINRIHGSDGAQEICRD
ncbi:uncharacterized [Tachysurus ichikawai]